MVNGTQLVAQQRAQMLQTLQGGAMNLAAATAATAGGMRTAGAGGLGLLQAQGPFGQASDNPLLALMQKTQGVPMGAQSLQQQLGGVMQQAQQPFASALSQQAAVNASLSARLAQQQQQQPGGALGLPQPLQGLPQQAPGGGEEGPAFDPNDFPSLGPSMSSGRNAASDGYAAAITQAGKPQAPPDINSEEFPALGGLAEQRAGLDGMGAGQGGGLEQLLRAQQLQAAQLRAAAAGRPGPRLAPLPLPPSSAEAHRERRSPDGDSGSRRDLPWPSGQVGAECRRLLKRGPVRHPWPDDRTAGERHRSEHAGRRHRPDDAGAQPVRAGRCECPVAVGGADLLRRLAFAAAEEGRRVSEAVARCSNPQVLLAKTFSSPWAGDAAVGSGSSILRLPSCYLQIQPQRLAPGCFAPIKAADTLLYIFYSMPGEEAQLHAADELCTRGWNWHKDLKLWFLRVPNTEPTAKGEAREPETRGSCPLPAAPQ